MNLQMTTANSCVTGAEPTVTDIVKTDYNSIVLIVSAVILTLSVVSGVIGNLLVFMSVYRNRSLRTANNALLVNLAVGDSVVCCVGIPIMVGQLVNHFGDCVSFGNVFCPIQTFIYVLSSCVQHVTLVAISLERHQAIVHPFETKKKRQRVIAGVCIAWITALLLAVFAAVFLKQSSLYLICTCRLDEKPFDYLHTTIISPLGITCLICVVIFYLKIFRTVRKHVKKKSKSPSTELAAGATLRTSKRRWCLCCLSRTNVVGTVPNPSLRVDVNDRPVIEDVSERPPKSVVASNINNSGNRNKSDDKGDSSSAGLLVKNRTDLGIVVNGVMSGRSVGESITPDTGVGLSGVPQESPDQNQASEDLTEPKREPTTVVDSLKPKGLLIEVTPATPSGVQGEGRTPSPEVASRRGSEAIADEAATRKLKDVQGSVCILNPEMRVRGRRNLEAKTAKRASYIIGVFSLCWLPLFVVSYVDSCAEVDIIVTCIALMSAALNPIVYTVVNKSFRTEFVKISRRLTRLCPGQ